MLAFLIFALLISLSLASKPSSHQLPTVSLRNPEIRPLIAYPYQMPPQKRVVREIGTKKAEVEKGSKDLQTDASILGAGMGMGYGGGYGMMGGYGTPFMGGMNSFYYPRMMRYGYGRSMGMMGGFGGGMGMSRGMGFYG